MLSREENLEKQINDIEEIHKIVAKIVEQSGFEELRSEDYFIWMYSVEPFAEC